MSKFFIAAVIAIGVFFGPAVTQAQAHHHHGYGYGYGGPYFGYNGAGGGTFIDRLVGNGYGYGYGNGYGYGRPYHGCHHWGYYPGNSYFGHHHHNHWM